jgi:hypothetical protein
MSDTGKDDKASKKKSGSATHEPWKRPGRLAQNPSETPPEKEDRQGGFEQVNKTS